MREGSEGGVKRRAVGQSSGPGNQLLRNPREEKETGPSRLPSRMQPSPVHLEMY